MTKDTQNAEDMFVENTVELRPIEESDLSILQRWRNSDIVMPYCRQYRPLTKQNMRDWFIAGDNKELFILKYDSSRIGVGGFIRIDWRNRKTEMSFYVGEDTYRTEEIISQAILCLVDYAFKTLNLHKIYFPCYSFNPNLPIYEKVLKREYTAKKE